MNDPDRPRITYAGCLGVMAFTGAAWGALIGCAVVVYRLIVR